jgi:hypothetical protein
VVVSEVAVGGGSRGRKGLVTEGEIAGHKVLVLEIQYWLKETVR